MHWAQNSKNVTQNSKNVPQNSKNVPHNSKNVTQNSKNVPHNSKNVLHNSKNVTQNSKNVPHNSKHVTRKKLPKKKDPAIKDHNKITTRLPGTRQAFTSLSIVPELRRGETINNNSKLILFWTGWFVTYDWHFGLGRSPFDKWECSVRNCATTRDKSLYERADVIVFNFNRFESSGKS